MWPFKKVDTFWHDGYAPLAVYNSEVARGLLHTKEWKAEMGKLQVEYNKAMLEFHVAKGWHCLDVG